jgi:hypothetical protein
MKWFKEHITINDMLNNIDQKLIKNFLTLIIIENFSAGLAVHYSISDFNDEMFIYLSRPDKYFDKLTNLLINYRYEEILEPAPKHSIQFLVIAFIFKV